MKPRSNISPFLATLILITLLSGCGGGSGDENEPVQDAADISNQPSGFTPNPTPKMPVLSAEEKKVSALIIEEELREALKKPFNEGPLTQADFGRVESLSLVDEELVDISLIGNCTNLKYLHIGVSSVSDISPISKLVRLEILVFTLSEISDVSPIAKILPNLKVLSLRDNQIENISPISNLPAKMYNFDIRGNPVKDYSSLKSTRLKSFWMGKDVPEDISKLPNINNLPNAESIEFEEYHRLSKLNLLEYKKSFSRPVIITEFGRDWRGPPIFTDVSWIGVSGDAIIKAFGKPQVAQPYQGGGAWVYNNVRIRGYGPGKGNTKVTFVLFNGVVKNVVFRGQ